MCACARAGSRLRASLTSCHQTHTIICIIPMVSKRVEQKGDLSRAVSKRRGVLLFSGGLDSTLSAITLLNQGTDLIALTIDYPSRPRREAYAARQLAQRLPFSNFIQVNLDTGGPLMKCG